ncbi:hypothetical protein LXL04_000612 [Taraxacum kok-saghyz]
MKDSPKTWKPYCCTAENKPLPTFQIGILQKCSTVPSFRRMSFSDLSRSSSMRLNQDIQSFGPDLFDFILSELRAVTQNFSSNFLLGEGGFGKVHKGYVDESMRAGLKAQPVAVKLLDIEGLQGHREWLITRSTEKLREVEGGSFSEGSADRRSSGDRNPAF